MRAPRPLSLAAFAAAALLAGCATPPAPDPTAETAHCYKSNKGRVLARTTSPAPSLNADAEAKRFTPDPTALTVYVVRRNWEDGRNFVKVQADNGPVAETLPDTMVRIKVRPGSHTLTFEFDGQRQNTSVPGQAGAVRFARIAGTVLAWKSSYEWAAEPEPEIRERARKARLVADIQVP